MFRLTDGLRPHALLLLLSLILFLPGVATIPPIDRDEARFAQASHQMLESGDYIRIRFQDQSRAKKPVGIYWMQAGAAWLSGAEHAIWAYRLPSVIGALAAVLLTFQFGQALTGRKAALIGASLLACSLILVTEAHQAKTDAVLLACVVAAQGILGRLYLAGSAGSSADARPAPPGKRLILLFWLAQGLGILVKGPIVPLISLMTLGGLWIADRRIGWAKGLRPLPGLILVVAMVAPWAIAVSTATNGQFIGQAVQNDLLPKLLGAQENHGAPPGTFLLLLAATMWPASLLAIPGFVHAIGARRRPAFRFCLAWIVPAWLLFEAVPTKLPHYTLPMYPALALLAGLAVAAGAPTLTRRWAKIFYALWSLIGLALAAASVALPLRLGGGFSWISLPCAVAALATGLAPALLAARGRVAPAAAACVLGAALTYGSLFGLLLPHLDRLWISPRIAALVPAGTPLAAAGFHEPSLVFLAGTDTRLTDGDGAARFLLTTPGAVAVVEEEAEASFHAVLTEAGATPSSLGIVDGFNYSRGRPARLTLWRL